MAFILPSIRTPDIPAGTEFRTTCNGYSESKGRAINVLGIKNLRFASHTGYAQIALASNSAMTNVIATIPTYPSTIDVNVSSYSLVFLRNITNQNNETVTYTVL